MFGSLYAARVVRLPSVPISLSFSSPFVWIVVYWPHCVFFLVFLRSRYRERGASLIPRRFWISLNGQTVHILNSSWKCSIFCYRPAVRTVLGMHACWLLRTNSCCCYCCEYLFTQRCEQSAGVSAYVHQQVSVRIFLEFFFSVFFIMLNGHSHRAKKCSGWNSIPIADYGFMQKWKIFKKRESKQTKKNLGFGFGYGLLSATTAGIRYTYKHTYSCLMHATQ